MKNNIALFSLLILTFASCEISKEDLITKKWKTVALKFPAMERTHAQYRAMLDTISPNHPFVQEHLNLDSAKRFVEAQIAYELEIMNQNANNSFLELKDTKVAYFTSTEGTDSSSWRIEENELVLEDEKVTDIASTTRMYIDKLTETDLELRSIMGTDTSYIKMKPYKD